MNDLLVADRLEYVHTVESIESLQLIYLLGFNTKDLSYFSIVY